MNLDTETKNRLNKRLMEVFPLHPQPELNRTSFIPQDSVWGKKTWIDITSEEYWRWEEYYYALSPENEHYYFPTLLKIVVNDERDTQITGMTCLRIWCLLTKSYYPLEDDEASQLARENYDAWKALFTPEQRELIRDIAQQEIFSNYHDDDDIEREDGELELVLELWR